MIGFLLLIISTVLAVEWFNWKLAVVMLLFILGNNLEQHKPTPKKNIIIEPKNRIKKSKL